MVYSMVYATVYTIVYTIVYIIVYTNSLHQGLLLWSTLVYASLLIVNQVLEGLYDEKLLTDKP